MKNLIKLNPKVYLKNLINFLIFFKPYSCECPPFFTGPRCERFDPCLNSPCSSNSICKSKIVELTNELTYECECNQGFTGRNCTIDLSLTCFAQPCKNSAQCLNVTLINDPQTLGYECLCSAGYKGSDCSEKIDFCQNYEPCQNSGKCINSGDFSYSCNCASGWTGTNCTQDINECQQMRLQSLDACSGQGQCLNIAGSFQCTCNEYFHGQVCEEIHVCQRTRPCENGGLCLIKDGVEMDEFECKCPFGFTGTRCEFPTCESRPCRHNGRCEMLNATQFICNCTDTGFYGRVCGFDQRQEECMLRKCNRNFTCDPNVCDCDNLDCVSFVYFL